MAVEKLKGCDQSMWLGALGYSKGGVCFYMSEYVQKTTWAAGSYADAKKAASSAVPATIMASGKVKNLADRTKTKWGAEAATYRMLGALTDTTIYRMGLWIGPAVDAPAEDADPLVGRNHAAIVAVGTGGRVLFFEPNHGFYEAVEAAANQKTLLETSINGLYNGAVARNFVYLKGRKLKD